MPFIYHRWFLNDFPEWQYSIAANRITIQVQNDNEQLSDNSSSYVLIYINVLLICSHIYVRNNSKLWPSILPTVYKDLQKAEEVWSAIGPIERDYPSRINGHISYASSAMRIQWVAKVVHCLQTKSNRPAKRDNVSNWIDRSHWATNCMSIVLNDAELCPKASVSVKPPLTTKLR